MFLTSSLPAGPGSAPAAGAGDVELRTRSVGDDLTSAVLKRCSQSPLPRDSYRFT